MSSDANDQPLQPQIPSEDGNPDVSSGETGEPQGSSRRKILIGSQRDPDAYKPKPKRDWVSGRKGEKGKEKANGPRSSASDDRPADVQTTGEPMVVMTALPELSLPTQAMPAVEVAEEVLKPAAPPSRPTPEADPVASAAPLDVPESPSTLIEASLESVLLESAFAETTLLPAGDAGGTGKRFPPPNIRAQLPPDLEREFQAALADVPLDTLMSGSESVSVQPALEAESRHTARVVNIGREDVFLELGGREQAVIPLRVFPEPPQPGAAIEVVIVRFNHEDGFYEATLPMAAAEIGDWSHIAEGMLVEARVTGHNTGGLECEVSRLRGFIPVSHIALYRVENLEQFVDQKFTCLVTEANPQRRNLVLSRRAVLEREREEARRTIMESLAPGQVREGVIRKIMDFGAFVDLGSGVDGLLHVSQLGWGRVRHPSEVVQEGQKIQVRVDKVDPASRKISLSYKDLLENPWSGVDRKYATGTVVHGRVVKIMEFGAFVELEPGVDGLVHISELSHKRVARVSDVVKEGDEIEVAVLSVDTNAQRISLSMKTVHPLPEAETPAPQAASQAQEPPPKPKPSRQPTKPLLGGLGRSPKGANSGLKW